MSLKFKVLPFVMLQLFASYSYADVSNNQFIIITQPLQNLNIGSFDPDFSDASTGSIASNDCFNINGQPDCQTFATGVVGTIGAPVGLEDIGTDLNENPGLFTGLVAGFTPAPDSLEEQAQQLILPYVNGVLNGDQTNSYYAYGTLNSQGPNGILQGAAGVDFNSASISLRYQNKDLIGSGIAGIDYQGNIGITLQTQTKDGFDQAVVGGYYSETGLKKNDGVIATAITGADDGPVIYFTGATVQGQSNLGFAQYSVNGDGTKQTSSVLNPDGWSVTTTDGTNTNTFAVTSSETQSYNKLNMNDNRITDLAPGILGTDAVNLNQLNRGLKTAYQGVAGVAALSGIPAVPSDKRFNMGLGVGNYQGQTALAVGGNVRISDTSVGKLGISVSGGNVTSSAGVGFAF